MFFFLNGFKISDIEQLIRLLRWYLDLGLFKKMDGLPHFVFVLSNRLEAEPSSMIYNRIECFYFFLPFIVWNETTRYWHKQSRDSSKVCVIYAFAQECNYFLLYTVNHL